MKISFYTLGCKQNYAETSHIREQFEKNGSTVVEFGEPCDAVLINTCTVTENADVECRKIIRRAMKHSPDAWVGITGCYAQLQPEEIASVDGVDAVFGAKEKFNIQKLVTRFEKADTPKIFVDDTEDLDFVEASFSENDSRTRSFLKMQDGCDYNCSFCTIPMARGASRSMNFSEIEKHIRRLEQAGYHEVILTGINLGEYNAPTGERFIDVLKFIDGLKPNVRVRLSSVEPNKISQEIIELIAESETFCKHFHLPLQSGSAEVLRMMRRRYKADYYADLIGRIKSFIPHAGIGADVITGFPGETDELFEETYSFIHGLPISYLHVFTYSERDNTPAIGYPGKVPVHHRKERTTRLRSLSVKKKFEFYQQNIGAELIVIPEMYNSTTGRWNGYTENYIRTEFAGEPSMIQQPMRVLLQSIDGDIMIGESVNSVANSITPEYIPLLIA
ncbi:MAG: tRNA (N(6)-L-threonylcarbamoyladenosine(37)-C(2))-methylthiotransferase MtaB [Candidatus Kapaibacterium sp.]|nr:tRNA (N(6)-L-threonylcarbamoyladenosine(37)-C(2))-methylthiotransferase MtaB [Bacteroidota bacterium]